MLQIRMTALFKRAAIGVGVALCVAPIFTSAYAQQSGSQNWALEVQALRQEIAELRDMIERQQYEMRKLKSAQQPAQPSYGMHGTGGLTSNPSNHAGNVASGSQSSHEAVLPSSGSVDSPSASVGLGSPSLATSGNGASQWHTAPGNPSLGQATSSRQQETVPHGQQTSDANFYNGEQPARVNQAPEPYESALEYQTGAPVSESLITVPPAGPRGYPPVVDRSIGAVQSTQSDIAPARIGQANTANTGDVYSPEQYDGNRQANTYEENDINQSRLIKPNSPQVGTGSFEPVAMDNGKQAPYVAPQTTNSPQTTSGVISVPSSVLSSNTLEPMVAGAAAVKTATANTASEYNVATADRKVGQFTPEASNAVAANVAPKMAETDYYAQAFSLLKESKHDQAVVMFQQQIETYPYGERADDAYYWIAESMYVNRKLDESKRNFKAIIDNYKQSPRLPDAMLKTAYIEADQGNQIEARILFQEIVQFHPRSNAAISAKNRLADGG